MKLPIPSLSVFHNPDPNPLMQLNPESNWLEDSHPAYIDPSSALSDNYTSAPPGV